MPHSGCKTLKKLNIHNCFFDDFVRKKACEKYLEKIDLLVMSHVLEHISSPLEVLSQVKSFINPKNGFLYIEVPNVLKPYADGVHWQNYCDPGHIYYYSPTTLKAVIHKAGYEIVSMVTDELPPYFPIFCLAKPVDDCNVNTNDFHFKNDILRIQKAWLIFRIKHWLYYSPRRLIGCYLRRIFNH